MADSPADADFDVDPVVSCPSCGQLNRVQLRSVAGRFRCARCRAVLGSEAAGSGSVDPAGPMLNRARGWVGVAIVLGLVAAYLAVFECDRSGETVASAERPVPMPTEPLRAPLMDRRLPQNMVLQEASYPGNGRIAVSNGTRTDAHVKLVHPSSGGLVKAFHVRARSDFEAVGVPDGEFALLFALGRDWDHEGTRLTRDRDFTRFDELLVYETRQTPTADGVLWQYPGHRVTLHPVLAGDAPTHDISEAERGRY